MTKEEFAFVGKKHVRGDALDKVMGTAAFTADIRVPRMLHGAILRSPHPHAKILGIDTSRAERLSGVVTVITGRDIPNNIAAGYTVNDQPLLAVDKVRFIGEPVAAVAAVELEVAKRALELINVRYEVLPAVFDPDEAIKNEAPVLHAQCPNNIAMTHGWSFGDVDEAFRNADFVYEDTYRTQIVDQAPLEMCGAMARAEPDGGLTIWASTQAPFQERALLAGAFGIPLNKIRISAPYLGGAFGDKERPIVIYIAAALAKKVGVGRPVRVLHTREEEFACSFVRHSYIFHLKFGVKKDGRIVARECRVIDDIGAYVHYSELVALGMGDVFEGKYKPTPVRWENKLVYTNKIYGGAYRGFGTPEVTFAVESHVDTIARKMGIDPVEFRLINALEAGEIRGLSQRLRTCGLKECIREAARAIGWGGKKKRDERKRRGIGVACGEHWTGWCGGVTMDTNFMRTGFKSPEELYKANPDSPLIAVHEDGTVGWRFGFETGPYESDSSTCVLTVNEDGTATLNTGDIERGQGLLTALQTIVAEELGIGMSDVKVNFGDTNSGAFSPGTYGSRATYVAGNAAKSAAEQAKGILFKHAAEMMEARVDDLEARDGKIFVKGVSERFVSIPDVAFRTYSKMGGNQIVTRGAFDAALHLGTQAKDRTTGIGAASAAWNYLAQAAEVEVDIETGEVKLLRVASAHDLGRVINRLAAEGQVEGAVAQGIGYSLSEGLTLEDGRVMNPNYLKYEIPSVIDMPEVVPIFVETVEPSGPFGAKGVGEAGQVAVAPAIANAIFDAVGVRVREIPITPEKVLLELQRVKG